MPKVVYECELCSNPFDSEKEAEKCEQSHYATCANPKCGAVFVQIPKTKVGAKALLRANDSVIERWDANQYASLCAVGLDLMTPFY